MEKNALGAMENHKKGIVLIIKPIKKALLYEVAEPEDCKEDGCYYSVVDEKAFMEKMKEWHVELEDNKPEERPPWKEQI